jgi:hypothetical protein
MILMPFSPSLSDTLIGKAVCDDSKSDYQVSGLIKGSKQPNEVVAMYFYKGVQLS